MVPESNSMLLSPIRKTFDFKMNKNSKTCRDVGLTFEHYCGNCKFNLSNGGDWAVCKVNDFKQIINNLHLVSYNPKEKIKDFILRSSDNYYKLHLHKTLEY